MCSLLLTEVDSTHTNRMGGMSVVFNAFSIYSDIRIKTLSVSDPHE